MIDALMLAAGLAAGFATTWREVVRLRSDLAAERGRVGALTTLLMSREAPAEYATYVEPAAPPASFPENAIWADSGLYYVVPGED